jgi:hypothetical protein
LAGSQPERTAIEIRQNERISFSKGGSVERLTLRKANASDSAFAYRVKKAVFRAYGERVWGWAEAERVIG